MADYRVAVGHDQPLIDLVRIQPQPFSDGVQVTRRTSSGNGTVHDQGLYLELVWPLFETDEQYRGVLGLFGLNAAQVRDVTVFVRDDRWLYGRFNGLAVRPQMGVDARWRYFPTAITIRVRNLKELT
jgi:hypothetical protein